MLRRLIAILGCIHLVGGSFGVLQLIAWTNMLVVYSSSQGVVEGISRTFDGEHPCSLCLAIAEAKDQQDDSQPQLLAGNKLALNELTQPEPIELREPQSVPGLAMDYPAPGDLYPTPTEAPPVPPPRC